VRRPPGAVEAAIEELRRGRMVVVCDGDGRESEGDLLAAAEFADAETINFMAREARGLICLALSDERCEELALTPIGRRAEPAGDGAFMVSIEARDGVTTGISAADRAQTIRTAIDPARGPEDLVRPGHVFPLRARPGGVLERGGHTEAAVELAELAGQAPAAVLCEILSPDGTMSRGDELAAYADRHGLALVSVADLLAYRRRTERQLEPVATTRLPTRHGTFQAHEYRSRVDGSHHLALVRGSLDGVAPTPVHVHTQCVGGESFGSLRCDCGPRLEAALAAISAAGRGVLVYLAAETSPATLLNEVRAHALADPEHERGLGEEILADLGLEAGQGQAAELERRAVA